MAVMTSLALQLRSLGLKSSLMRCGAHERSPRALLLDAAMQPVCVLTGRAEGKRADVNLPSMIKKVQILNAAKAAQGAGGRPPPPRREYRVTVALGGRPPLFAANYTTFGRKRERVPCPLDVVPSGVLTLSMTNELGQYYEDSIAVSLNDGFQQPLKWLALAPFALTVAAIAAESSYT